MGCDKNKRPCACTYTSCPLHGKCCECIASHREKGEFPGCLFTKKGEKMYDRSWKVLKDNHI